MTGLHVSVKLLVQALLAGYTTMGGETAFTILIPILVIAIVLGILSFIEFLGTKYNSWQHPPLPPRKVADVAFNLRPSPPLDTLPYKLSARRQFISRVTQDDEGEPQPDGTRIGRAFVWQSGEIVMNISKDHMGKSIIDMAVDPRGRRFFKWMLKQNFTETEENVARCCLDYRTLAGKAAEETD